MANRKELEKKIISQLADYSDVIIEGTELVIKEYREGKQPDSDEIFNLVIQGINWEIEVFNNCEDTLNSETQYVDKAHMAQAVGRLGKVLAEKDSIQIAACLEVDFLPFLRGMREAGAAAL